MSEIMCGNKDCDDNRYHQTRITGRNISNNCFKFYSDRIKTCWRFKPMNENKFVVGQKVICIKHTIGTCKNMVRIIKGLPGMKSYNAREFISAEKGMLLDNDYWIYQEDFKTIIQTPADCIPGMTLTVVDSIPEWVLDKYNTSEHSWIDCLSNKYIVDKIDAKEITLINNDCWWPIELFKEYQPLTENIKREETITMKTTKETHRVAIPFTIKEIADCDPCFGEFISLMNEVNADNKNSCSLSNIIYIQNTKLSNHPTLLRNLSWMEANLPRRIVKIKAETKLYPGMKLTEERLPSFICIVTDSMKMVNIKTGETLLERLTTLEELNSENNNWVYPIIIKKD